MVLHSWKGDGSKSPDHVKQSKVEHALKQQTSPNVVLVRFVKKKPPYNLGEVAGFAEGAAKILVACEICEYVDPPEKSKPDPDPIQAKGLDKAPLEKVVKKRKRGRPRKYPKPE